MQEHQLFQPGFCGVEAHLQAAYLPVHHLFVVRLPHIEQPAPGAADGVALHGVGVVVQDVERIEALGFQVGVHLVGGGPPIVVIALHDELLAGQLLQKFEIPAGIGKAHGPADVACEDDGVLRLYELAPVGLQPFHIAVPAGENVHRLGAAQGKVGIAKHKKCHSLFTPVLVFVKPDSPVPPPRSEPGR